MSLKWLLAKMILRDLMRNKVRTGLTIAGIALGVTVMLGIQLANRAALDQFKSGIDIIAGRSNLSIQPSSGTQIDESLLDRLSWLHDHFVKFTPVIDRLAVIGLAPGTELVQVLGVDMFADEDFRDHERSREQSQTEKAPPLAFLKSHNAMIGERLAKRYNLKAGSRIPLQVDERMTTLTVSSVLHSRGVGGAFGGNVILMDIGPAQQLFSMKGISRIDLIVPEDQLADTQQKLTAMIPPGLSVEQPERRGKQVEKMLSSFQYNLVALSLIALLVAMFLIYNTMSISVIRRRAELGTLRTLGVQATTIFLLFAGEAAVLGIAGSLAGAAGGIAFAKAALLAVSQTIRSLYADQPPAELVVAVEPVAAAILVGTVTTMAASIPPCLEAVSVAPAEATRRASFEARVQSHAGKLALAGIVLAVAAIWASRQLPVNGFPLWGFLSAAASVFAVAFFMPLILSKVLPVLKNMLSKIAGIEAGLAVSGLFGALGRTSVAVASLVVGISMMVSLAVMIGSFRQTVIAWVDQTLRADIWVTPAGRKVSRRIGRLDRNLAERLRSVQGIAALEAFTEMPFEYEGSPSNLGAGQIDVVARYGNLPFIDAESSAAVMKRVEGRNAVVVSESFSIKHNKRKGDEIVLPAPSGPLRMRIEGVYYDYSSELGFVVMDINIFRKHFTDEGASTLAIYLQPGFDTEKARQNLLSAAGSGAHLNMRSNREIKSEVLRVFDNTFAITYALHAISIAVAILSVMNTLFALVMESKRDIGLLRYLGAAREQLRRIILYQAIILAAAGSIGGLITGFILSWLLIHVINKQSFGWTVQFAVPFDFLIQSFILILLCAIASSLVPARLAADTPAPEALRLE